MFPDFDPLGRESFIGRTILAPCMSFVSLDHERIWGHGTWIKIGRHSVLGQGFFAWRAVAYVVRVTGTAEEIKLGVLSGSPAQNIRVKLVLRA
jgi:hypothetical protein